jgi:hypothetical protein
MPTITDSEKIEVLFNKSFGIATTLPTATIEQVSQDSAAEKIIPASQIYTQEIPSVAPTDLEEESFNWPINPTGAEELIRTGQYAGGRAALPQKKYKSTTYPWIKKYENFQVLTEQDQVSYSGKISIDNNILAHTIPFNQDRGRSYAIKVMVYDDASGGFLQFQRDDQKLSWNYDKDAGFITFYGDRSTYLGKTDTLDKPINPIMTFWRYEGNFGFGTSNAGPTGAAGIAGATGAAGIAGTTGSQGPTGPAGSGGGTYANDEWLITNLLGESPPVVFGTPVRTSDTIYIPWSYPTQRPAPWGSNVLLPIIDRCTIAITVDGIDYSIHNNVNTYELINGITTVLAITKTQVGNGFNSGGGYTSAYFYSGAGVNSISNTSVNSITVFYSNSLSPFPNPSSIQFPGFLPTEQIDTVTISGTAVGGQQLTASLTGAAGISQITYQWNRAGVAISGATNSTYTLTPGDVNSTITVTAYYTDANTVQKNVTSTATSAVTAPANNSPTGSVTISGTAQVGQTLTAANTLGDADGLGQITYQWKRISGGNIAGAINPTYLLVQADFDKTITVTASYTDTYGRTETVTSSATVAVTAPPNNSPIGSVTISGTTVGGQTLTASNTLEDLDGLGPISYKWYRSGDAASIATGTTYKLTPADVNKTITAIASYTDGYNRLESMTSNTSATVTAPTNTLPTGSVTISGTAQVGQTLTASAANLVDPDTIGTITYKWYRSGDATSIATATTYLLVRADFEKTITVTASYTDGYGTAESVTSSATAAVIAPANTLPTGSVTISGTARVGLTLVSDVTGLIDPDVIGAISYQWNRNGVAIASATNPTYTLVQADFEKTITVTASYTDGYNRSESKTSAATAAVIAPPNNSPTGSATISGTAVGGETLSATLNNLADADGLGTITYKWYSGVVLVQSTASTTYKLGPSDVGKTITVVASYTDGYKNLENVTSGATSTVTAPANTPATGNVTISGNAVGGQTLTANVGTIADVDGVGTFAYQWNRAGVAVSNATNSTYLLGPLDVGNVITVIVSFTDGYGYAESKTSVATAAVTAPVNTLPTGSVTISGNTQSGQTLTATVNNLVDPDGTGAITYQWKRNGVAIPSATNSTYVLIQSDVGQTITVTASYTDGYGRSESLTSSGTTIPAVAAPAEPAALTSISLNSGSYASNSSTIYRVLDRGLIGSVPLINAAQVATLQFNAPIHRLANIGTSGASTLMTLSASLNAGPGPSVSFSGFPATTPAAATSNNITITPNSVTDVYTGNQAGYYLTSTDTITAVPSAGSSVNALTATQTFSNATTASASATFYYDTPVTTAPTCSINALTIPTKVSGLSILYDTSANITIDATANNMGKYFYRSPLITYRAYGAGSGSISESTLTNVRTSDISNGNMFTNGNLNFSSPVTLTGINNAAYSTTATISIDASANNIFGPGAQTSRSFNVIMDPSSGTHFYKTQSTNIPVLTQSTVAVSTPVYGARIWSAPITTNATGVFTPDFSYNGIFYYTMPYDNTGSLTSTDPSGCKQDLLISNGTFVTPTTPSTYIDYSGYAGNAGLNYSTIPATAGTYRFATFCWKMPTVAKTSYLSFYIESVYLLTRAATMNRSNATSLQVFYAFQNVANPTFATVDSPPDASFPNWNSVWIQANVGGGSADVNTYYNYNQDNVNDRYGLTTTLTNAPNVTTLTASGIASFYRVFVPPYRIVASDSVYLYLRVGLPMNKDMRFGRAYATFTI